MWGGFGAEFERKSLAHWLRWCAGTDRRDLAPVRDHLVERIAKHKQVTAHQPVPLSSWRPGGRDSAVTDWGRTGYHEIAGHRVALSCCYESILGWPVLWQFLSLNPPEVIVELANHHWESPESEETRIQRKALMGIGRLFGVPVLFADNRP